MRHLWCFSNLFNKMYIIVLLYDNYVFFNDLWHHNVTNMMNMPRNFPLRKKIITSPKNGFMLRGIKVEPPIISPIKGYESESCVIDTRVAQKFGPVTPVQNPRNEYLCGYFQNTSSTLAIFLLVYPIITPNHH